MDHAPHFSTTPSRGLVRSFINHSTRTKLVLAFGLIIALLGGVVLTGYLGLQVVDSLQEARNDVMELRNSLNRQRGTLLASMLAPGETEREAFLAEIKPDAATAEASFARIRQRLGDDAQWGAPILELATNFAAFTATREEQLIPLIRAQKMDEARALAVGLQQERFLRIRGAALQISADLRARLDSTKRRTLVAFAISGAVAILAAVILVAVLTRLIARPLEAITAVAAKIADGDLSAQFSASDRTDEVGVLTHTFQRMSQSLGQLAGRARQIAGGDLTADIQPQSERDVLGNAFKLMTENLRAVIRELAEATNVLASSTTEITAATAQMAASAAETASAVTETTTTLAELKQNSGSSSEVARHVSAEAHRVAEVAQNGRESVEQVIAGMDRIREQMGSIAASVLSLNVQSQTIGEIIASVDDLAAQSKILAINASMEAAKAGEEGKGFAVVAQEVKSLAEQSRQATNRVRAILTQIEKATATAVLTTEQGGKAVESGVRQSTSAGESIGALAENIARTAHMNTQIATASQQQFTGLDHVALAMDNIQTACATAVAGTRQTEAAAQQLSGLSQRLRQIVAQFKV